MVKSQIEIYNSRDRQDTTNSSEEFELAQDSQSREVVLGMPTNRSTQRGSQYESKINISVSQSNYLNTKRESDILVSKMSMNRLVNFQKKESV